MPLANIKAAVVVHTLDIKHRAELIQENVKIVMVGDILATILPKSMD